MAIKMLWRLATVIFVEFPGQDSYETIVKTITRGDPNQAQGTFAVELYRIGADIQTQKTAAAFVNVQEPFLVHAYEILVDFIADFQRDTNRHANEAHAGRNRQVESATGP